MIFPNYIITLNRKLEIVSINRTVEGVRQEQVLGRYFPDFTPEFREIAIEKLTTVLETQN